MKTTLKKIASLLICLCLIISGMVITASAADTPTYTKIDKIANLSEGTYFMAGIKNSEFHCFTGSAAGGHLATSLYSYSNGTLTTSSTNAAEVDLVAVSGKTDTFYIKVGTKYVGCSSAAKAKLTVGTTAFEWVANDHANGGIYFMGTGTYSAVVLGSNKTASSNIIRNYVNTSSISSGVVFFKLDETTPEEPDPTPDPEEPGQGGGETPDPTPDPEEPGQGGGETPDPTPDTPTVTSDSYVKVTEAPADWSGTYLIVYEDTAEKANGPVAFKGSLSSLDSVENGVAVTINNGVIAATTELNNNTFTIAKSGTGYSVKSASNKYIGYTSYGNGLSSSSSVIVNSVSLNADSTVNLSVVLSGGTITLKYNAASNQMRFRYYKSGQEAICLYKYEEAKAPDPEEPPVTPEPEEPETEIKGTDVEVGSDLTANYVVTVKPEDIEGKTLEMKFTMNGVSDSVECDPAEIVDGTFTFAFEGIGAQCMSDTITAALVSTDNEGNETVHSTVDYRIKDYAQTLLNDTNSSDELKEFVSDMLRYGDAAQLYRNYNLDNLATKDVTGLVEADKEKLPTKADEMSLETTSNYSGGDVYFKSATIRFSNVNSLVIKLNAVTAETKLYVNGDLVELDGATYVTDGINADKYDDTFTFELKEGDELIQTLTYSINAYAFSMQDSSKATMASLARALYAYGASAKAYAETLTTN